MLSHGTYVNIVLVSTIIESAIWGLIALVTSTGNANSTQLRLVQFHTLPVPVTRAINPHIALPTVLLTHVNITITCGYVYTIALSHI